MNFLTKKSKRGASDCHSFRYQKAKIELKMPTHGISFRLTTRIFF